MPSEERRDAAATMAMHPGWDVSEIPEKSRAVGPSRKPFLPITVLLFIPSTQLQPIESKSHR